MFSLIEIRDNIASYPSTFGRDNRDVLAQAIDAKYANKVLSGIGLGICIYDFISIGDAQLLPGAGATHTQVHFRLLIFKPFEGEVVVGRVERCTPEGIIVNLEFFRDILIPAPAMLPNSKFLDDPDTGAVWVWNYYSDPENEEDEEPIQYFIEVGQDIRFRVLQIFFSTEAKDVKPPIDQEILKEAGVITEDTTTKNTDENEIKNSRLEDGTIMAGGPGSELNAMNGVLQTLHLGADKSSQDEPNQLSNNLTSLSSVWPASFGPEPAMLVAGSIAEDGLGMVAWWEGENEDNIELTEDQEVEELPQEDSTQHIDHENDENIIENDHFVDETKTSKGADEEDD